MKRTITDLVKLKGKRVLLRVDFNVPLDDAGKVMDDTRIVKEVPTIKYLSDKGAKVIILSHLGRPNGEYDVRKSLWPAALELAKNLPKCNVSFCNKVIGKEVDDRIAAMKDGDILLLENVRFHKEEEECDMKFARKLARMGDIFVDDAFAVAHRQHASNFGVARILPNAIGFLMEKELTSLAQIFEAPKRPLVAIVGGAKVESKVKILDKFVDKADVICIGGAMAYTFMKAQGIPVGMSLVFDDNLDEAKDILLRAHAAGKRVLLPVDHVCIRKSAPSRIFVTSKLTGDMVGYDIGPKTIKMFTDEIKSAGEVFWNGTMGLYELDAYRQGTHEIALAMASTKAHTSVGGGDTVAMINLYRLGNKINYISTGGGAALQYLEGGSLPAVEVIQEKIK